MRISLSFSVFMFDEDTLVFELQQFPYCDTTSHLDKATPYVVFVSTPFEGYLWVDRVI